MNNNNFAMMRYFHDLGAEAHLLLYEGDGSGTLSHFTPEADTWNISRWAPFIHQTKVPNAYVAALDFPLSWLMAYRGMFRTVFGAQDGWSPPVSRKTVDNEYKCYGKLIASGISPATLFRVGKKLNIYYPYSIGVEFVGSPWFLARVNTKRSITRYIYHRITSRQIAGIRNADYVINSEIGPTEQALRRIGVDSVRLAIPMVYNNEKKPLEINNDVLAVAAKKIISSSVSILHHARIMWSRDSNMSDQEYLLTNKNSHWVIHGLAKLLAARPTLNPLLCIVEYGPEVDATKALVSELGLTDYVFWLPKMLRKELMWLLSKVTVGCGEFYNIPHMICGGTGWEVLASGKPLLQGFHFEPGEYERMYGQPPPPMLQVRTLDDVLTNLLAIADDPMVGEKMGKAAADWFDRYNGVGLAKQWLDLLKLPQGSSGFPSAVITGINGHG